MNWMQMTIVQIPKKKNLLKISNPKFLKCNKILKEQLRNF